MHWVSIEEIKRLYQPGPGRHWFDPSTLRFFRSRLPEGGYMNADGQLVYFITSERFIPSSGPSSDYPRMYSIRVLKVADRDIDTIGDFQGYRSRSGADAAARRLAESASRKLAS